MLDKFFKTIEKIVPEKYKWVLTHDGFKRYFANTGWMFFGQMFSLLVSFFIGAWLARYLGPENYGVVNYVVAFVGLFSFIASLGIDGILSEKLVSSPEKRDELLGTAFRLKLLGGMIAIIFATITAFLSSSALLIKELIVLYSFSFVVQSFNVIPLFFQSKVLSKNNTKAVLFATILSSVLKIFLIMNSAGVIWLVLIYFFDSVWQSIGYLITYNKYKLKISNWKFDRKLASSILRGSWLLMFSSASVYIYMKVDQVMIGYFMGEKSVGLYAAAVKFVEIWYFIPAIICSSLFPAIVNSKKNELVYKKRLKALYLLMVGVAVSIAIPSTFFASWAINILFGKDYLSSVPILQIYIWSGVGLFLGWAINQYLLSEKLFRVIFYYNLLAMIVNVVLNLILIPLIGINGAAWATLAAYSVGPILFLAFNKKFIKKYINNNSY